MNLKQLYRQGTEYSTYLKHIEEKTREKVKAIKRRVDLSEYKKEIEELPPRRVLAFSESWCPDCIVNLTVINEVVDTHPKWELKVTGREGHEGLLAKFYQDGRGRIPTVLFLDDNFQVMEVFKEKPHRIREAEAGDDQLERVKVKKAYREGRLWRETVKEIISIFENKTKK